MTTKSRKAKRGKARRKHAKKLFARTKTVIGSTVVPPKPLVKGDRVRSIVDYRRGMQGKITNFTNEGVRVDIESTNTVNGKPVTVNCLFQLDELERVA